MLKLEDKYRTIKNINLNQEDLEVLFLLYEPLIGKLAVHLYLFLFYNFDFENHQVLCDDLKMNIDEFCYQKIKCEEVKLIKTYKHQKYNQYLYEINKPLSFAKFLNDDIYSRMLIKNISQVKLNYLLKRNNLNIIPDDFIDISTKLSIKELANWNQQQESKLHKVNHIQNSYLFDIKLLLSKVSEIVFPINLRTGANLKEIQRIAEIYGVNTDRMIKLLSKVVNYLDMQIDLKSLEFEARNLTNFDVIKQDNPYMVSCVQFLKNYCQIEASNYDKYLINLLSFEYKMPHYLINVLLEFALESCQNHLYKKYLESVASNWRRNKITTIQQAKDAIKNYKPKEKTIITMEYGEGSDDFNFEELNK